MIPPPPPCPSSLPPQALKANDLEAYQELLKAQQGAPGASTEEDKRFEVIAKFLGDTETYLEKLANKVAMVSGGAVETGPGAG